CVTGNVPFKGITPAETISSVINQVPQSPRTLRLDITNELEEIIMRLLSKNKEERYASAYELFSDLDTLDNKNSGFDFMPKLRHIFRKNRKRRGFTFRFLLKQVGANGTEKKYSLTGMQTGNNQYTCVIGRATPGGVQPDVDIPEPTISRRHIEIILLNGQLGVRHLYSQNRTTVNGNKLEPGVIYQLSAGDRLMLGKAEFELMEIKTELNH
ncbi:MAG: FHA domain-containing protein, partial [Prolixibacteraceae bacterium]